jgi:hypothetical protein
MRRSYGRILRARVGFECQRADRQRRLFSAIGVALTGAPATTIAAASAGARPSDLSSVEPASEFSPSSGAGRGHSQISTQFEGMASGASAAAVLREVSR